ncbi:hypothetical protein Tco_1205220 [Tanacetum coccineum]
MYVSGRVDIFDMVDIDLFTVVALNMMSSETTKEPVCDFVTHSSLPQHDSSTPCKDSVCESITPRCIPHCMLTPPSDESVITYTQLSGVQGVDTQDHVIEYVMRQLSFEETELDGEAGFGDVARSGIETSGLSHDESFGVDDLDLNLNEPVDTNGHLVQWYGGFTLLGKVSCSSLF